MSYRRVKSRYGDCTGLAPDSDTGPRSVWRGILKGCSFGGWVSVTRHHGGGRGERQGRGNSWQRNSVGTGGGAWVQFGKAWVASGNEPDLLSSCGAGVRDKGGVGRR